MCIFFSLCDEIFLFPQTPFLRALESGVMRLHTYTYTHTRGLRCPQTPFFESKALLPLFWQHWLTINYDLLCVHYDLLCVHSFNFSRATKIFALLAKFTRVIAQKYHSIQKITVLLEYFSAIVVCCVLKLMVTCTGSEHLTLLVTCINPVLYRCILQLYLCTWALCQSLLFLKRKLYYKYNKKLGIFN